MPAGIRAEVAIDDPPHCLLTEVADATAGTITSVTRSVNPETPGRVTEEFVLEVEPAPDSLDLDPEPVPLFAYGSRTVYRVERDHDEGDPCDVLAEFDCPVVQIRATGVCLSLTFHAPDMPALQSIVGTLMDRFDGLDVRRLLQSEQESGDQNLVFIDRNTLTARQLEVLETAHRMGYFDHPKGANAGEVAGALEISGTTFAEHLAAGQRKLLRAVLD